jgi:hypothetical protein
MGGAVGITMTTYLVEREFASQGHRHHRGERHPHSGGEAGDELEGHWPPEAWRLPAPWNYRSSAKACKASPGFSTPIEQG